MSPERIRPGSGKPRKPPAAPPPEGTQDLAPEDLAPESPEPSDPEALEPAASLDQDDREPPEDLDDGDDGESPDADEALAPAGSGRRGSLGRRRDRAAVAAEGLLEAPAGAAAFDGERAEEAGSAPRHHGLFRRLYYGETNFEFVGRKRLWFLLSSIVIFAGVISLGFRGLNLDIQFVGGTAWTVQSPTLSVTQTRNALSPYGIGGSTITILGSGAKRSIQVEAKIPKGQTPAETQRQLTKIQDVMAGLARINPSQVSIQSVGPSWGGDVTKKAIEALIVFFILVSLYISVFFEWRMALAAVLAVIHDILVTVGIYSLTGFDVTPDTVVAILTILGYSLYDTVVVFDRVRDNLKGVGSTGRLTISDVVNLSMNQTLARSINTSTVAVLPILAVLLLGAEVLGATTLEYFGLALIIGLTSGAYSSIFIASPLVAVLKEREPRWRRVRDRLVSRNERLALSPLAFATGLLSDGGGAGGKGRSPRAAQRAAERRAGRLQPTGGGSGARRPRPDRLAEQDGVEQDGAGAVEAESVEAEAVGSRILPRSGAGGAVGQSRPRRPSGRPGAARPGSRPRRKGGRR